MTTKQKAVETFKATVTAGTIGFVFQFPAGHWSFATEKSSVGKNLAVCGAIYTREDTGRAEATKPLAMEKVVA